jgi:hypothetical protein
MKFREFINEAKDIRKEVLKRLKKNGEVMLINDKGLMVSITDVDEDGYLYGMDQHDNDVEIDSLKGYSLDEAAGGKKLKAKIEYTMKNKETITIDVEVKGDKAYFTVPGSDRLTVSKNKFADKFDVETEVFNYLKSMDY